MGSASSSCIERKNVFEPFRNECAPVLVAGAAYSLGSIETFADVGLVPESLRETFALAISSGGIFAVTFDRTYCHFSRVQPRDSVPKNSKSNGRARRTARNSTRVRDVRRSLFR